MRLVIHYGSGPGEGFGESGVIDADAEDVLLLAFGISVLVKDTPQEKIRRVIPWNNVVYYDEIGETVTSATRLEIARPLS